MLNEPLRDTTPHFFNHDGVCVNVAANVHARAALDSIMPVIPRKTIFR
jgi:hypothetical protein